MGRPTQEQGVKTPFEGKMRKWGLRFQVEIENFHLNQMQVKQGRTL